MSIYTIITYILRSFLKYMKEEKTILFQDNFIHNSIKDAFLQLLTKKDYMQITITVLCKCAGAEK